MVIMAFSIGVPSRSITVPVTVILLLDSCALSCKNAITIESKKRHVFDFIAGLYLNEIQNHINT
jgi:hypothetical protein